MKINRQELLDTLLLVMPGLASKEVIEQSGSFVFADGEVFTFNDQIAVRHPFKADIEGAVSGKKLLEFLKRSRDDEFEVVAEQGALIFKGKKNKATIKREAEVLLPVKAAGSTRSWDELPSDFIEALKFCSFSVGTNKEKPKLTCIHVCETLMESTDGFRLTRVDMSGAIEDDFLIPGSVIKHLIQHNPTHVGTCRGWLHFKNKAGTLFCCRTYMDEYVNTSLVLKIEGEVAKWPKDLAEAVQRAAVFSSMIRVSMADGMMKISSMGDEGGYEEEMRVRYTGEISFLINAEFFQDILGRSTQAIVGQEKLKFEGDNWLHICMLMRDKAPVVSIPKPKLKREESDFNPDDDDIPF